MPTAKRKVSVSLDEDLVKELEREEQGLSAQLNLALRAELERRRRNRLLEDPHGATRSAGHTTTSTLSE